MTAKHHAGLRPLAASLTLLAAAFLAACAPPATESAAPAPAAAAPAPTAQHPDFSGVWMAIGVEKVRAAKNTRGLFP